MGFCFCFSCCSCCGSACYRNYDSPSVRANRFYCTFIILVTTTCMWWAWLVPKFARCPGDQPDDHCTESEKLDSAEVRHLEDRGNEGGGLGMLVGFVVFCMAYPVIKACFQYIYFSISTTIESIYRRAR